MRKVLRYWNQDFDKSVELNPTFPTAYVQKLYTDYRQAVQQNNQVKIQNVLNLFEKALDKYPECIETYALFAQVNVEPFDRRSCVIDVLHF